jgi:hypothetical protein
MGSFLQGIRKWWDGYLSRLTKANKESFGSGKMDCCGLGKEAESRKHP